MKGFSLLTGLPSFRSTEAMARSYSAFGILICFREGDNSLSLLTHLGVAFSRRLRAHDLIRVSKALGFRPAGRVDSPQEPGVHCLT